MRVRMMQITCDGIHTVVCADTVRYVMAVRTKGAGSN